MKIEIIPSQSINTRHSITDGSTEEFAPNISAQPQPEPKLILEEFTEVILTFEGPEEIVFKRLPGSSSERKI